MRIKVAGSLASLLLLEYCLEVLEFGDTHGLDEGLSKVSLVLPWQARGTRVRLFKTAGPWGLIALGRENNTVAHFDAKKVMFYLIKIGAISLEEQTPNKTA